MHDDLPDDSRDTPVAARGMFRKKGRWHVVIGGDHGERRISGCTDLIQRPGIDAATRSEAFTVRVTF